MPGHEGAGEQAPTVCSSFADAEASLYHRYARVHVMDNLEGSVGAGGFGEEFHGSIGTPK